MANTEPTGGPTQVDPMMLSHVSAEEEAKIDAELEAAFGPLAQGRNAGAATTDTNPEDDTEEDDTDDTEGADTDPNAGASAEGEGEGGEDGQQQTSGAIGGDASDFATLFRNRYNRDPEPGELEGYIQLAEWASQLTPEQSAAINNALADPSRYLAPQNQPVQQTQQQDDTPDPLVEEFGEDHPLIQRIRQLEQAQQQFANTTVEQRQQKMLADISAGAEQFKTKYSDLSDIELEQLQGAVAQSRIFPGFVQASNGDVTKAMQDALDYAYWQNPTFRQREADKQLAAQEDQRKADATRKKKAASVTGSSGNGASRTAAPPKTNDDRWAAVAAGIAEAQGNGQQN